MACLDNTQAYNAFVFIIIKDNTLKYIWTCVIWVCYHQNLSLHELNSVFVGYAENSKAYRLLDLESNVIVESRDVKFFENKFINDSINDNE